MKVTKGFTLIELIVSIAIFSAMTALVIAKYGTFNQGTLVTNVAYDMALTIRTAQTYGLSVKSNSSTDTSSTAFNAAYGIHFDTTDPIHFVFFADLDGNHILDSNLLEPITKYTLSSGTKITKICMGSIFSASCSSITGTLDVTYKRPNPDAIFYVGRSPDTNPIAFIFITSSDGTNNQVVYVRQNGQISVNN